MYISLRNKIVYVDSFNLEVCYYIDLMKTAQCISPNLGIIVKGLT
jgi:hypothetical protein